MAHADTLTLLLAIVAFFIVGALVWWSLAVGARLARRASLCLALSNAMLAGSLIAHLLRGSTPDLLAYWGSDLLSVGGFAVLRAAVPAVAGRPLAWRSALAISLPVVVLLFLLPYQGDLSWHARLVYGGLTSLSLLACIDAWRQLRSNQVNVRTSALLITPLAIVCALIFARLLANLLAPVQTVDMRTGGQLNLAWLWATLLLSMVLNANLAFLVLMRLILKIRLLTRHDPLTQVLNRRALGELIDAEHGRCVRGQSYALVMIDMDHFKQLNDSLSHAAGDAALRRMVAVLAPCLREGDSLGRLGGEEFCVLLPMTEIAGAALVAARMRDMLETCEFEWQGQRWQLTASFGIACAGPEDLSAEPVLARADAATYRAKAQGRNLVLD